MQGIPESGKFLLMESPTNDWDLESTWNPESEEWNLESQTFFDFLTWGDLSFLNSLVFYSTMATSGPSQAFVQLSSSEEGNWLSLGRALTSVLCKGLRPYIEREMDKFYKKLTASLAGRCTCGYVASRKKNQYHVMRTCVWAQTLLRVHIRNKPNWKQSDSKKWMDPNKGKWEIAKLFIPGIELHTVIKSAEDLDISGILNLMIWCNHFTVQRPLLKDVREIRNTKWVHVSKLELSEAEKRAAFQTIEKLLQDPEFIRDPDAQDALQDILTLKCSSDVHIFKAEVLSHFKEAIRNDMSMLKSQLKSLRKESKKNKKQRSLVERQLRNLKQGLGKVGKKCATSVSRLRGELIKSLSTLESQLKSLRKESKENKKQRILMERELQNLKQALANGVKIETATSLPSVAQILVPLIVFVSLLIKNVGKMQKVSFICWMKLLLLYCCVGILDYRSYKDGMFD